MKIIAPALLLIGLIFAVASVVAVNNNITQKESTEPKQVVEAPKQTKDIITPEPLPELKEVSDCDRGYIKGYNNGIKAYCDTGVDVKGFEPSVMCYDIGYDRGFNQGVKFAEQELDIETELNK